MINTIDIPNASWYKVNPEYIEEIEISDDERERQFDEYYENYQEIRDIGF